ncbi:MAG: hypothetical protein A2107_15255 [Verrucomicrobia bacterium GWF2_62_7]|nr:MAG: hypothetical protein A2107_15255 [Verrucomicrobia bacterium GWF2_62_7]
MSGSHRTSWLGLLLAAACGVAALADEIRHNDVLYLDEVGMRPIPLKARHATQITFSRGQSAVLGSLRLGQAVRLIGYSEKRYYVEKPIALGTVRGWVDAEALEPLTLEQRAVLDQQCERARTIKPAIARHEVLIGMTQPEVLAAVGQPQEKSSSRTAQGDEETWSYVTYRYEPYTQSSFVNGFYVTQTLNRKVVTGGREVVFRNGVVTTIRAKEGGTQAQEMPPPVVVPVPVIIPQPMVPHKPGGKAPSLPGKGSVTPPRSTPKPPGSIKFQGPKQPSSDGKTSSPTP